MPNPTTNPLRAIAASQLDEAGRLRQLANDSRSVIEDTRRLLADPMWDRFGSPCPGNVLQTLLEERAVELLRRAMYAQGAERHLLIHEALEQHRAARHAASPEAAEPLEPAASQTTDLTGALSRTRR